MMTQTHSKAGLTPVLGNAEGEPNIHEPGGILDTLYGLDNLQRIDDNFEQLWVNINGCAFAMAKYAGSNQILGYFAGSSGTSFVELFTVYGEGYLGGTPNAGFLPSQTGNIFRFGNNSVDWPTWSSKISDNTDSTDHMVTWLIKEGPNRGNYIIAWEDGGDQDYQDLVVELTGVTLFLVGPTGNYSTIQEAINDAVSGMEIIVLEGIYNENISFLGKDINLHSLGPVDSIAPENQTVVRNTIIDGTGLNGRLVLFWDSYGAGCKLNGFTLRNGMVGGIYCVGDSCNPRISNCLITGNGNLNLRDGGGLTCTSGASPAISNCTFSSNTSKYHGGGMRLDNSAAQVTDCTFKDNVNGGIYCTERSSAVFMRCIVNDNSCVSGMGGGGIFCGGNSAVEFINCDISNNSSTYRGGGVECGSYYYEKRPKFINCTITNNTAGSYYGGGFYCYYNALIIGRIFFR